ncbi:MAG TPA: 1-(5-phosphoribosyl)-5-[(5-phosphoribosylamino)methylideneamino]imidazole-4-carboxamide isomerase [Polyangiaceae bacterium]
MQIIPAIDLFDGRAVRLRKGRYEELTRYYDDPTVAARQWSGLASRLHVVDLEGAREGRPMQPALIARIVAAFGPGVQVGGGVRTLEAAQAYFDLGVERVVLGTVAIEQPELVRAAAAANPHRIVVALDARGGLVATQGWIEQSQVRAVELAQALSELSLAAILYTDIERDGTEAGPNISDTALLAKQCALPVIASGGVGTLDHLRALAACNVISAVVVGRALHEGRFTLEQALKAVQLP